MRQRKQLRAEVLAFLTDTLRRTGGIAPTIRDIAAGVRCSSVGGVRNALRALERDGLIRRLPHRDRSIEVVGLDLGGRPPGVPDALAMMASIATYRGEALA